MLCFTSVTIIYSVLNNAMNRKIHKASIKSLIFVFIFAFVTILSVNFDVFSGTQWRVFPRSDIL